MARIPYPMDHSGRAVRAAHAEIENHRKLYPDDEEMLDALAEVYEAASAIAALIAARVRESRRGLR